MAFDIGGKPPLRSELEIAIFEANLGEKETFVARLRFIEKIDLIEICGEFEDRYGYMIDRATASRWLKKAENSIQSALTRMPHNCT